MCLSEFRKRNGFTKKEIANLVGVSHSFYEKIEYSDRNPSYQFLAKFKNAFPLFDMNIFFDPSLHASCCNSETETNAPIHGK